MRSGQDIDQMAWRYIRQKIVRVVYKCSMYKFSISPTLRFSEQRSLGSYGVSIIHILAVGRDRNDRWQRFDA